MPVALPFISKHEIAAEVRLGSDRTEDAILRTLRKHQAISKGISALMRGKHGSLSGRLHLYSALNLDAARALRRGDETQARRIAEAAARVEQRVSAKSIFAAAVNAAAVNPRALADVMSNVSVSEALIDAVTAIATERMRLEIKPADAVAFGYVSRLTEAIGALKLNTGQLTVPLRVLSNAGLAEKGTPVMVRWEIFSDGASLLAVEPAVEIENDLSTTAVAAPAGLFDAPWGSVLSEDDGDWLASAIADPPQSTITRPSRPVPIRG